MREGERERQVVTHKFITFPRVLRVILCQRQTGSCENEREKRRREQISQLRRRARFYARGIY